jgi:hypothetical protein
MEWTFLSDLATPSGRHRKRLSCSIPTGTARSIRASSHERHRRVGLPEGEGLEAGDSLSARRDTCCRPRTGGPCSSSGGRYDPSKHPLDDRFTNRVEHADIRSDR